MTSLICFKRGGVVGEAVCCVRSVFHSQSQGGTKTEDLPERFL